MGQRVRSFYRTKSQEGFSLLEVLVATAILLAGLLGVFGVFPASISGISESRNTFIASQGIQALLESWTQNGYTWISSQPAGQMSSLPVTTQGNGASQTTFFTENITHSSVVSGGVEQVDVLVSWWQGGALGTRHLVSVRGTTWVKK